MAKLIIEIDGSGAKRTAADLEAALKRLGIQSKVTSGEAKSLGSSFGGLRSALAAVGAGAFVRELMNADKALFQVTNTLKVASGSALGAERDMAFLRKTANTLGLDLNSAALSFAQFSVAARGTALEGQGARNVFVAVSEAATAMGLSADSTRGALVALQQMVSKGTVSAEELRGQLGERLPGAFNLAAKAMGMTTSELGKALQQGDILASDLLPRLAVELHNTFGEQALEGAKGLAAEINRLSTAWQDLLTVINKSGVGDAIKATVVAATNALRSLTENWHQGLAGMYQFAADTFELIGGVIADSVHGWAILFAGLAAQLAKVNFLPGADATRQRLLEMSAEFYSFGASVRETADDLSVGFGIKAQDELKAWVGQADAAAESTGRLAAETKKLGEAIKFPKKLDRIGDLGVPDEFIRKLELAEQLTASVATESERHGVAILIANSLLEQGLITQETYRRVLEANRDTFIVIAEEASQWAETMRQIGENFTRGVQDAFADFFTQIFTTGKVGWKDLLDTIWKLFAQMLSKMLTEWIATETKKTMETIRQNAIRSASNRQSSNAGGGGGGMGGLAGYMSGVTGLGSTGGSAGSGSSAGAIGGWITILFALYVVYKGFIENHDMKFSEASFGGETAGTVERWGKGLQDAVRAAKKVITDFAAEMHLGSVDIAAASGIIIGRSEDNTYYVRGALYSIAKGFKTIEEAMEYAAVAAMKIAEYGREVSELVRAAIRNSSAETLQDLRSDIEFARRLESAGKPDFFAGMIDAWNQFLDDWKRAVDLFLKSLDQLPVALSAVGLNLVTSLRDTYNQLTGYKPTRAELLADAQMRATMFNAQRALTLAELRLRAMEIEQRIRMLQNLAGIIGGGNGGGVRPPPGEGPIGDDPRGNRGKSLLEAQVELWQLELNGKAAFLNAQGQLLKIESEQRASMLATLQAQLDALLAIIAQIEAIPEIKPEDIKLPRVGGGRSRADRLREQADLREQASLFGASDVKQQLYDAAHSLDDYIERVRKAGFSQAETARLIAAATAEEKRRQDVIAEGIRRSADQFVARGRSPATAGLAEQFAGIDKEAAGLIAGLRELRKAHKITTAELIKRMADIAAATDAMKRAIALDTFINLAQRMAEAAGDQEMLLKLEKLRWQLELANMKVQIEFLRTTGLLSAEQMGILDDLYERVRGLELPVGGGNGSRDENAGYNPAWWEAQDQARQEMLDAMRRLTAAIDKLREFDESLLLSNQSPLTTQQRFSEAQRQFADIASRAQSSDVAVRTAAIEALPAIERTLLEVASAMFGTSGAGYATIFDQIRALNAIITGGTFTPVSAASAGNVVNAQGSFGGGGSTATAGGVAATNVYMNTTLIEAKLDRIGNGVDALNQQFEGLRYDVRRAGSLAG